LDIRSTVQFNIRRASDEAFDVERGEGAQIVFVVRINVEDGVADLLPLCERQIVDVEKKMRTLTLMVREKDAFCALYPCRRTPAFSFQMQ
jgi:hypothetical protein